MKKVILSFAVLGAMFFLHSCNEAKMDPAAVQAKVDSLAASKIEEATAKANSDCESRMATELKTMSDSIVNATQMAQAAQ